MGYPTTAELVEASNVSALTSLTEDQQDSLRLVAIAAIEEHTGQQFTYQASDTKVIDSPGGNTIYLPRRLITLGALDVSDGSMDAGDVEISTDGSRLTIIPDAAYGRNYYEQTMREIQGLSALRFPYGLDTVTITGSWGWSDPPEPVVLALRKDMEDTALADANALNETLRAYRKMGLADISQGNLRASIGASPGLSDEVIRLLRPFQWVGELGAVV